MFFANDASVLDRLRFETESRFLRTLYVSIPWFCVQLDFYAYYTQKSPAVVANPPHSPLLIPSPPTRNAGNCCGYYRVSPGNGQSNPSAAWGGLARPAIFWRMKTLVVSWRRKQQARKAAAKDESPN